jgi:HSP20 family protein
MALSTWLLGDDLPSFFPPSWLDLMPQTRRGEATTTSFLPRMDQYEKEDKLCWVFELPGMSLESITIEEEDGIVTVSGEKKREEQATRKQGLFHRTIEYGVFSRSFKLPPGTPRESLSASVQNGILTVSVNKPPESQPRRRQIAIT